ncbi:phosphoglycerate kinase-like isoform X2 [Prunus dulcis]|uniref:phosphoglycerate kinase-like isoform X2 n=1 Tax=Prunus dulcis TaxID=3755 RepID=UPI00148227F8|nr:phosphoglycerate kinase-like isoform X2 [Prunus dulcis]
MGHLVNPLQLQTTLFFSNSPTCSSIALKPHTFEYLKANVLTSKCKAFGGGEMDALPHLQTLRKFPREELVAKVVLVRFDSTLLLREQGEEQRFQPNALFTITYLHQSGAKVVLVSDWSVKTNPRLFVAQSVAEFLSSLLEYKVVPVQCISQNVVSKREGFEKGDVLLLENLSAFRGEVANCSKFSQALSSGVDIFVNDYFSRSHKILASTCGVARFCYANLAGFHFEESLSQLRRATESNTKPHVAIIGGGNLFDKAAALHSLTSRCDGLVFVGMMSFQIMHALGLPVPLNLVEHEVLKEALDIVQVAHIRNVQILYPKDFWCKNDHLPKQLEIFPAHRILDGWVPVDIGPASFVEMKSMLSRCKKVTWIGPVKFRTSNCTKGDSELAQMLNQLSQSNCNITVVGNTACDAMVKESNFTFNFTMIKDASVVWEFLKRRKLPGVMALDRLVKRCLDSVHWHGIRNGYFIATNATSTFRSIISSYPGKLVLVSIQCPNPDFNEPDHRWSMLQRSLVEAVADLLTANGKVFLQSDIEAVSLRMKEQFQRYGKGKLTVVHEQSFAITNSGWLKDNPFGVRSDWEQHVLARGDPMYRLMLCKSTTTE